ncbi:phosphatase PAP2 family protein [Candidatus Pyrohabitans sp.]
MLSLDALISGGILLLWLVLSCYALVNSAPEKILLSTAAMVLSFAVNTLLKLLFRRERPREIDCRSRRFYIGVQRYSFPSAHVQLAFTALALVRELLPGLYQEALILAIATALSRLYLGKHHPGDVLAGAALGYATGYLFATML